MDFYGVGIYIVIIIVAGLFVAFIILLMARSMLRGTSTPSQERETEELPRRKLTQRLRLRLKPERVKPAASSQPEVQMPPPVSTESEPGQPASPGRPEPEPSQQVSLEPETRPTNTIPQETEVTTSPSLEEMELPESFDNEEEKSGQGGDVLNLFRVEEVEDTGLSELAASLEDADVRRLAEMTKDVSREIRGK